MSCRFDRALFTHQLKVSRIVIDSNWVYLTTLKWREKVTAILVCKTMILPYNSKMHPPLGGDGGAKLRQSSAIILVSLFPLSFILICLTI